MISTAGRADRADRADHLATRYGGDRGRRRSPFVVVAVLVAAALAAWLGWAAWSYATPQVSSELTAWQVEGQHRVTARVDVRVDVDPDEAPGLVATCLVRAYAEDHAVVGEQAFEVPAGADGSVEVTIRTERLATSVDNVGCTTPGQSRPR